MRTTIGANRRILARAAVLLYLLAGFESCARREKVQHGVQFVEGGMRLRVASLGSCGCVTFQNKTKGAATIVTSFKQASLGSQILEPQKAVRVRFDWGGPDGDDVYDIIALVGRDPKPADQPVRLKFGEDSIDVGGIVDARCNDEEFCEFGSLNMNRAAAAPVGQDEVQTSQRGVHAMKGNEVLEVAASDELCGCVVLSNETADEVSLIATLRGTMVGGMKIKGKEPRYFGFDAAGEGSRDVYSISAVVPRGTAQAPRADQTSSLASPAGEPPGTQAPPPAPAPGQTSGGSQSTLGATDRTIKFGEGGIRVIGQMEGMLCTAPKPEEERRKLEQTLLTDFRAKYPEEQIGAPELQEMAKYAAGVRGVLIPEFDAEAVKKIGKEKVEALLKELDQKRGPVADGAAFELPTGDRISCPFGELNMDQMWRRLAPTPSAGTQGAAKPKGGGAAPSPRKE